MSSTCHAVLQYLAQHGPAVAADIAEALSRCPMAAHRALRQLHARGIVGRRETAQAGVGRAPMEWFIVARTETATGASTEERAA